MTAKVVKVGIAPDAIEKLSKVAVELALEELVWNAIDAEASRIDVVFHRNQMEGIERIVVSDDGHGFTEDEAGRIFKYIGGSLKRTRRRSPKLERPYHGKEGQGRYKAFSLGRRAVWHSRSRSNGSVSTFSVTLDASKPKDAVIESPEPCDGNTGCDVVIDHLLPTVNGLDNAGRISNIVHRLAPYLIANRDITIVYDGETLDVAGSVTRDEVVTVTDQGVGEDEPASFALRILEWNKPRKASLFWCDADGVCYEETPLEVKGVARYPYSAYILTDRVRDLSESSAFATGDMNLEVRRLKDAVRDRLRTYFRERKAEEARNVADKLKEEGLYPYKDAAHSPVEKAERQVFDILAAQVHEYLPSLDSAERDSRKFTYRLLREALESSPTNLTRILHEVLKLNEEQQKDLVGLLNKTSLGAIIESAKIVADRLTFINGLEQILHDKTIRKCLLERTQLHRILAEELWIFGDEYTLGTDDVSLRTVLDEHRSVLGMPAVDDVDIENIKELADVPDLMLWRQYLWGKDRYEHLVIELKRPKQPIGQDEISQVRRYVAKVLANLHFDKEKTHWTFIALSDRVAADAEAEMNQTGRRRGHITQTNQYDIWVMTWSQVIQEAKTRLDWIRERLNFKVAHNSEGMEYMRSKYSHLLPKEALEQPVTV